MTHFEDTVRSECWELTIKTGALLVWGPVKGKRLSLTALNTSLRSLFAKNRVSECNRDLSTMIPKGLAFDSKALTASSYWTYFNLRFPDGRFSADSA